MIASLIAIVGAVSITSWAKRFKFAPMPRTMMGPVLPQRPMIHTPVNAPQLQMQAPAFAQDDSFVRYRGLLNLPDGVLKPDLCDYWISTVYLSDHKYPPKICGMDARELLHRWIDSFVDPFATEVPEVEMVDMLPWSQATNDVFSPMPKTPKYWQHGEAMVLQRMQDVIADMTRKWIHIANPLTTRKRLEMVGLLSKDGDGPKFFGRDSPVVGLALFSREKFKDDSMGSLCNKIGQQDGTPCWTHRLWGKAKKHIDVFAIEALASAPGQEHSARDLLSELNKYARKEKKVVVVPKRACVSSDGTDLTAYYVRMGFEKVEMKSFNEAESWHDLVYIGTSSDEEVQNQQMMVGMNLGANIWE